MKSLLYSILALSLLVVISCTNPPEYPNEPTIEFVSMSKTSMLQSNVVGSNDSILLTLSFTDGDGDIGSEEGDSSKIHYYDPRQNFEQIPLEIPFVGLQGIGQGISGEIYAIIPSTCCVYDDERFTCSKAPGETDEVVFEMWIVDRAGNESNRINLPPITILCE